MSAIIEVADLKKTYQLGRGRKVQALHGVSFEVREGEIFGLLGPNGAGKTTTIGILTTRVRPSGGRARICDVDAATDPIAVKKLIAVVPQRMNLDRGLRVREILTFHAHYFGIPVHERERRADELLEWTQLKDRAKDKVDKLSGGMNQRLMIARALMHDPKVLFLDEATLGLDPQSRLSIWDKIRELHGRGLTIMLTTHYMEEADQLCDRVAIIDHGKILALDTPKTLKKLLPGGNLVELQLSQITEQLIESLKTLDGVGRAEADTNRLRLYVTRGGDLIPRIVDVVEQHAAGLIDIHLATPTLESVFIYLTGRELRE